MGDAAVGGGGTIRGVVGAITWAYYTAARIEGYTVTRSSTGAWSLSATIVVADAFKLSQRPLQFVAPHQKGKWTWPITDLELGNSAGVRHIRATLGPPLE